MDQEIKEELKGSITLRLPEGKTLDEFCEKNFNNYNRDQYEAVAIRFFYGKDMYVTLYALDKVKQEGTNYDIHKLPVKKFKSNPVTFMDVLSFIDEFNFTLTTGNHSIEDMEVINK